MCAGKNAETTNPNKLPQLDAENREIWNNISISVASDEFRIFSALSVYIEEELEIIEE